ncbi:MAG TPA: tryptophan--tRNA ligase [Acidimicrobiales bacterium]|nr:tryptophan--tRNA ligase [Acidimicrobiales bacterium]
MARVFSGIQPSGTLHIGNYFGAIRQWVASQAHDDTFYCIVDLHALTVEISPEQLRSNTLECAATLLAAGLDPAACTFFVQSHVAAHAELTWLLECVASFGELRRMTQFKEKGAGRETVRASLFTYPVLMAADILLYGAERVPVGDDQRQHLELTRDLACRFNARYGETFVVPEVEIPPVGARIMDLQAPTAKMSKSTSHPLGLVSITEAPESIVRKVRRAVTDPGDAVRLDRERQPGVTNLLEILAAATGTDPEDLAGGFSSYAALKSAVADALVEVLAPIRRRYEQLRADPGALVEALAAGAEKAAAAAAPTLDKARAAIGLTERSGSHRTARLRS